MSWFRLTHCCCCDVVTASLVMGIIGIAGASIGIVSSIVDIAVLDKPIDFAAKLPLNLLNLASNVFLVVGIQKREPVLVK